MCWWFTHCSPRDPHHGSKDLPDSFPSGLSLALGTSKLIRHPSSRACGACWPHFVPDSSGGHRKDVEVSMGVPPNYNFLIGFSIIILYPHLGNTPYKCGRGPTSWNNSQTSSVSVIQINNLSKFTIASVIGFKIKTCGQWKHIICTELGMFKHDDVEQFLFDHWNPLAKV
jgi:hypothetical protein